MATTPAPKTTQTIPTNRIRPFNPLPATPTIATGARVQSGGQGTIMPGWEDVNASAKASAGMASQDRGLTAPTGSGGRNITGARDAVNEAIANQPGGVYQDPDQIVQGTTEKRGVANYGDAVNANTLAQQTVLNPALSKYNTEVATKKSQFETNIIANDPGLKAAQDALKGFEQNYRDYHRSAPAEDNGQYQQLKAAVLNAKNTALATNKEYQDYLSGIATGEQKVREGAQGDILRTTREYATAGSAGPVTLENFIKANGASVPSGYQIERDATGQWNVVKSTIENNPEVIAQKRLEEDAKLKNDAIEKQYSAAERAIRSQYSQQAGPNAGQLSHAGTVALADLMENKKLSQEAVAREVKRGMEDAMIAANKQIAAQKTKADTPQEQIAKAKAQAVLNKVNDFENQINPATGVNYTHDQALFMADQYWKDFADKPKEKAAFDQFQMQIQTGRALPDQSNWADLAVQSNGGDVLASVKTLEQSGMTKADAQKKIDEYRIANNLTTKQAIQTEREIENKSLVQKSFIDGTMDIGGYASFLKDVRAKGKEGNEDALYLTKLALENSALDPVKRSMLEVYEMGLEQTQEGKEPKITMVDGMPYTWKNGGLEPVQGSAGKQIAPKFTMVDGEPYLWNAETNKLEKVQGVEGGGLTAPKITMVGGMPYTWNKDTQQLEPVAGTVDVSKNKLLASLDKEQRARVDKIANNFDNEAVVKNFSVIQEGVQFANSLDPKSTSPSDDQALIYSFAKVMDPNSVVREGEYATVQKYAQSWLDTLGFNASRILSNKEFLTPEARANMKATMQQRYDASLNQYENVYKEYGRRINAITGQEGGESMVTDYRAYQGFPGDFVRQVESQLPAGMTINDVKSDLPNLYQQYQSQIGGNQRISTDAYKEPPKNDTQEYDRSKQCGAFVNDTLGLSDKYKLGDTLESKMKSPLFVKGGKPIAGGYFVMDTGTEWGHVGLVLDTNPDGSILVKDKNWDGKGTERTTVISPNDPDYAKIVGYGGRPNIGVLK